MGDDACWLNQTCLSCGRFLDREEVDATRCPHCGAERVVDVPGAPEALERPRDT
jgi:predicted Zn-ribbon and HTH transcriptional regulator